MKGTLLGRETITWSEGGNKTSSDDIAMMQARVDGYVLLDHDV